MKEERRDGLVFLIFGALAFLIIGLAWKHVSPIEMGDFKVVYYASRCLLQHRDPYSQQDVLSVYRAEGRESPTEPSLDRDVKTRFFYPPTAFILTVPIALAGFEAGKLIWTLLCAGSLILAAFLVWDASAEFSPTLAGLLSALLLAKQFLAIHGREFSRHRGQFVRHRNLVLLPRALRLGGCSVPGSQPRAQNRMTPASYGFSSCWPEACSENVPCSLLPRSLSSASHSSFGSRRSLRIGFRTCRPIWRLSPERVESSIPA